MQRLSQRASRSQQLTIALACAAAIGCAAGAAKADLLYNGNLNIAGGDSGADGWTKWGYGPTSFNDYKSDPNDAFTLDHTAYVNAGNYGDWWSSGAGWFQVVAGASAGKAYSLDVMCATEGWDNAAGEMRLIYLDASNTVIRQDVQHTAEYQANQAWTAFNLTTEAPLGTTQVKVEMATWGARGAVLWDNASLNESHLWNTNADGSWFNAANWVGGVPNAAGAEAQLKDIITANHTVTVDSALVLGSLRMGNTNTYAVTGAGNLTLQLAAADTGRALLEVTNGTQTLNLPTTVASDATFRAASGTTLVIADPITVAAGKSVQRAGAGKVMYQSSVTVQTGGSIAFGNTFHASALNLASGANASAMAGKSSAMKFDSVIVNATARIDLTDNDMIIGSGTSATAVATMLQKGYDFGNFMGAGGISSSLAPLTGTTTLGLLTADEYGNNNGSPTFDGVTVVSGDKLIKYTWFGDVDFNGAVDSTDYNLIDFGFLTHAKGWANGDVDFSGGVDSTDYNLVDFAFVVQNGALRRAIAFLDGTDRSTNGMNDQSLQEVMQHFDQFGNAYAAGFLAHVPEPTSLGVVGLAAGALIGRRRRQQPQK